MPTRLASPRDQAAVQASVKEAGRPGGRPQKRKVRFFADGEEITRIVEAAKWGQTEIPISLDATLATYLPPRLQDAPIRVVAEVEDVPVLGMVGEKTTTRPSTDEYRQDLFSSSAGSLLGGDDAIKLGKFTEYPSDAPDQVVFDVVSRLPYDQSNVSIQPIPNVRVSYAASGAQPGFLSHERTGDVLARLGAEQTVGYDYRDTPYRGFVAWVPEPISRLVGDASGPSYASSQCPDWHKYRPSPPPVRYHSVRVFHLDPDSGEELWEWVEPIPYPPGTRVPHEGRTKDIPWEDATEAGMTSARQRCVDEALLEARALYTGRMLLPAFDPLVHRGDPYTVFDRTKDLDGHREILWAMEISSYHHLYGDAQQNEEAGLLGTEVSYAAFMLHQDLVKPPAFVMPRRAPRGIVPTPQTTGPAPTYGADADSLYFNDGTTFVTASGDDLIFTDDPNVAVTGDDIVVGQ